MMECVSNALAYYWLVLYFGWSQDWHLFTFFLALESVTFPLDHRDQLVSLNPYFHPHIFPFYCVFCIISWCSVRCSQRRSLSPWYSIWLCAKEVSTWTSQVLNNPLLSSHPSKPRVTFCGHWAYCNSLENLDFYCCFFVWREEVWAVTNGTWNLFPVLSLGVVNMVTLWYQVWPHARQEEP